MTNRRNFLKRLCATAAVAVVAPALIAKQEETACHEGLWGHIQENGTRARYNKLTEEDLQEIIADLTRIAYKGRSYGMSLYTTEIGYREFCNVMRGISIERLGI